jgi:hypothetical protein
MSNETPSGSCSLHEPPAASSATKLASTSCLAMSPRKRPFKILRRKYSPLAHNTPIIALSPSMIFVVDDDVDALNAFDGHQEDTIHTL